MNRTLLYRFLLAAVLLGLCIGQQQSSWDARTPGQSLAIELFEQRRYETGLEVAQREVRRLEAVSPRSAALGTALYWLGDFHDELGDYAAAERDYLRARSLLESALGGEHIEVAAVLFRLAQLYRTSGAYDKAEPLYQQARALRERLLGPSHPDSLRTLGELGTFYRVVGDYAKAEALLKRAQELTLRVMGPAHLDTARATEALGNLYLVQNEFARAEPLLLQTLQIKTQRLGQGDPDLAKTMSNLAMLFLNTGAYQRAIDLASRALSIQEKTFGAGHPRTSATLTNLASAYDMMEDYAKAEPFFQRSLAIKERTVGQDHPDTALVLFYLGELYRNTGDYAKSEAYHLRALTIRERAFGREHPDTADSLVYLGRCYTASGAFAKAEPLLLRALQIYERTLAPDNEQIASTQEDLAYLYWASDRLAEALTLLQRSQRIQAKYEERSLTLGSQQRKQDYLNHSSYVAPQDASFSVALHSPASAELGLLAVLNDKGSVQDAMSDSVSRLRASLRPEDERVFEELARVANELSNLSYEPPSELSAPEYKVRLAELSQRQEDLEARLAARSAEFRYQNTALTLANLERAIPNDGALIQWFAYNSFDPKRKPVAARWGSPRYVAYVLKHTGAAVAVDLGLTSEIDSLITEMYAASTDPQRTDVHAVAEALSNRLLGPLRRHLQGTAHLLLAPDGVLNFVPMAALLDERGRYLIERFEISYLTSGRDLLRLATGDVPRGAPPVVIANPDYGPLAKRVTQVVMRGIEAERTRELDRSGLVFRTLEATASEGLAIQTLLGPEARLLTGAQATEAALKQLHGPRILHVATHGFFFSDASEGVAQPEPPSGRFNIENPLLRSGLALAGANARSSAGNDGILTALEASRLDLQGTQLVVLSACHSGVGNLGRSGSIAGLRLALTLAGAQTQIATLWKVADAPTRELMVGFYSELVQGTGRAAALRKVQLAMLAAPERAHPYYWAGIVAIGAWTALPRVQ